MVIEDIINNLKIKAFNERAYQLIDLIKNELKDIDSQKLHNVENYKKLLEQLENLQDFYDGFHVITEYNKLVGFAGLYTKRWNNVGRILQCTYKIPSLRRNALHYSDEKHQHLWSRLVAPLQVSLAQKLKLDAVFVSLEYPRRYSSLEKFTNLTNKYLNGYEFVMQPHMYLTCEKSLTEHWSCWQNITLCKINPNYKFNFEQITHQQWKLKF